ncbi:MAG: SCO family protein [Tepidisphaerales bacterium]
MTARWWRRAAGAVLALLVVAAPVWSSGGPGGAGAVSADGGSGGEGASVVGRSADGTVEGRGPTADPRGPGQTFETFQPSRKEALPPELAGVGVDERLGGRLPLDLPLVDEQGQSTTLRQILTRRNRPVILQLGYFGCPMLCDQLARSTVDSLIDVDLQIGRDFDAIYLSFDPTEKPELAREKKAVYVQTYAFGKKLDATQTREVNEGWHFLTGPQSSTWEICRAAGFRFQWIESAKQYSHPAVLIMVSPGGTINQYLYGVRFDPKFLRQAIEDASAGRVTSLMQQIILMCFHFDPNTGKYTLQAMRLMQLGGAVTVLALGAMTGLMVLKGRQMRGVRSDRPRRGLSAVLAEGSAGAGPAGGGAAASASAGGGPAGGGAGVNGPTDGKTA